MKDDFFVISKEKIEEGITKALENSRDLVIQSQTLTSNWAVLYHVLGLYSFAIEEYGKALFLQDCIRIRNKNCQVPKYLFSGNIAHTEKFKLALDNLPYKCKTIFVEKESYVNPSDEKPTTITTTDGDEIELRPGHAIVLTEPILANFQTRLNCFYLGWDDKKQDWRNPPPVDLISLEDAMRIFKEILVLKLKRFQINS